MVRPRPLWTQAHNADSEQTDSKREAARQRSETRMRHPLDAREQRLTDEHRVRRDDGEITESVPEDAEKTDVAAEPKLPRESIKVPAPLVEDRRGDEVQDLSSGQ